MAVKVILDTNFLLIPGQFNVDIFSEIDRVCDFNYEIVVLDQSLGELKGIVSSQKGADRAAARLALQLVERYKVKVLRSKTAMFKNADKTILDLASREKLVVATQDHGLRLSLKRLGAKLIVLRQKKYLKLE